MNIRAHRRYFLISLSIFLFLAILATGCTESRQLIPGLNPGAGSDGKPVPATAPTQAVSGEAVNGTMPPVTPDSAQSEQAVQQILDKDWKTLRVINTDFNEHYLNLDLTKSDDVNYVRYLLVPETITRITDIRNGLGEVTPVTQDQKNETTSLIVITNYTILKYEGLSTMLHATQYAAIRDPVQLKAELRQAKFTIMDALDIINERDNAAYPSEYRDQIAVDKQELQEMGSQVDAYTRSVYLAPTS